MNLPSHWNKIYEEKAPGEMSWTQPRASVSLQLIDELPLEKDSPILDVGAGLSPLTAELLNRGFHALTVLDISREAIHKMQSTLGEKAKEVVWIEADITKAELPASRYHLWHDRAVFHFLTEKEQRESYVARLVRSVAAGGFVIFATFGPHGPDKCSGLPVRKYSPDLLREEIGPEFSLKKQLNETHHTPWGATQEFVYCLFQKIDLPRKEARRYTSPSGL